MSKSKADIIMENAVRHGLVTYRNITMEPVEPGDLTGLPTHEPVMNIVEEFLEERNPCVHYKLNNEGVAKFEQALKRSKP